MDIGDWLRSLGLDRYEAAFRENEINENVLPKLTAEDLKELGVNALGHRRTLLDAIAVLRAETTTKTPLEVALTVCEPTQDTAERRQVTVMFSDLVGSTALSARMDPEDLREIISAYQKCVAETVQRFGGFVAKYMGDGVLVYFGFPQAHEDDPERAVRAGLELIHSVSGLKSNAPLRTRVGIATGLVVVGDLIGSGEAQERGIVGETPNLAARLQGLAEPNSVVIAESTRKLLGNLFELEDLGASDFKGISGPVRAWTALRPSSVESRFEALQTGGLTELAGREEELDLLLRRWTKAKTGEGQVVLLSGEAGIGKSRLTAALMDRLAGERHTRMRYFCSPQHTDSALYPIIGQMERAAGITHGDTAQVKLGKLDALLAQTSTSKQDAALFAEMLCLPNDERHASLDLTPELQRRKTLEALGSRVGVQARQKPVLMIIEDAHWVDPTSLEAFGHIIDRTHNIEMLLIVTFRPEFIPPWGERPYATLLAINRLGKREIGTMIDALICNKPLSANTREDIIERTDGVPLFIEEMTKAVLEAGSQGEAQRTAAAVASPARSVPASLQASLMARLDRLGSAKEVAQIGAAIGREFSHPLLAAVAQRPEANLDSAVERLVDAGLLFREGVPPHATYLFKHALVQDAAYSTLLREPRRALHARIAEILESQFAEMVENQPELLARHCGEAGLVEKGAALWGKAGQRSLERSAFVESAEQITRALSQIDTLSSTPASRREQIKLQVTLITPLMNVKGPAAPETKAAAERAHLLLAEAEALGEPLEDPELLLSVLAGFAAANFLAFNGDAMRGVAEQFQRLAERQEATVPRMIGHRVMGMTLLHTGDIAQGRAHYDQALALAGELTTRLPINERVLTLCLRSFALWLLGHPEAAFVDLDYALSDARKIGHANDLLYALLFSTWFQLMCYRNYATAKVTADELVTLADKTGALVWRDQGMIYQGCVLAVTGKASQALTMISSGLSARRSTGATVTLPSFLSYLTIGYAELGQFDGAWRCIDEAIATIKITKERWFEAEVNRIAGEIALKSPEPDAAKAYAYFERALAIARQQHAKSWELRAAMSMARLWRDQGKRDEARELLAPVYGWFTEGFDTRDLKEAKALLDELAA
jgi:class 3 adenylate cyclase/predicted ATPase